MNSFDFNFHCLKFWRLVSPFDTNECRTMVAFIATTMVIIAKVTHCWDHGTWTNGASLSLLLILLPASLAIWHIPWDDLMRFSMGFFHTPNVSCPNQPPELLLMATYMSASWACMPNSLLCFLSPSKSVCRSWQLCFCCPWMGLPGNPSSVFKHIRLLISPGPHIISIRRPCICLMLVSHHETLAA